MPNKAYNLDFRMYMEGIQVPFKSVQIMCTPNGVEANINLMSNSKVFDLKPKTAIQIFYKDWVPVDGKYGWRLMFDGFLSSYVKQDQSSQGRGLSIVCRDFRMDIRKAPAAIAYQGMKEIGVETLYSTAGLNRTFVIRGYTPKAEDKKNIKQGKTIRTYSQGGLQDLGEIISYIAGTAYGLGAKQKNGEWIYTKDFATCLKKDLRNKAECGMFLDAVVRGLWTEAKGGTSLGTFMNRRIRLDKKFLIPKNKVGYNFWSRATAGLNIGSVLMGNSRFTSIEAAIMRLAGLFSVRVYSCNTPSLISLESDALEWIMDPQVKKFLVDDNKKEFGAKYILNETMLLPPLEFSSPPNCNLLFPPMYDRVHWTYDIDADVTRGYFKVVDTLSIKNSPAADLKSQSVQVPNALFDLYSPNAKIDEYGRTKPPLTLEERYKGVSVHYGNVENLLARNDASKSWPETVYNKYMSNKIRNKEAELKTKAKDVKNPVEKKRILDDLLPKVIADRVRLEALVKEKIKAKGGGGNDTNTKNALNRHAVLKFLNKRFFGRVVVVDMMFNPYPMAGFPGAIITDDEAYGEKSSKTIIGMVQQVKHMIVISSNGAEASTTVVLNNARFEDEPTDYDEYGNPLYMKETVPDDAEVNTDINIFNKSYYPPEPQPLLVEDLDDKYYDLDDNKQAVGHIFAKDLITLSKNDLKGAENNASYLDYEYFPNTIHKFYKEVFRHKSDHFMLGKSISLLKPNETITFAYDTIHEGLVRLRQEKSYLLNNYEECMKFIARDICSADAFFQGILGLSVKEKQEDGKYRYVNKTKNYNPESLDSEYYGITSDDWEKDKRVEGLKHPSVNSKSKGKMKEAGQFSSIKENLPITAFIQERRDAVVNYLNLIKERVEGVQFANIQRYRPIE